MFLDCEHTRQPSQQGRRVVAHEAVVRVQLCKLEVSWPEQAQQGQTAVVKVKNLKESINAALGPAGKGIQIWSNDWQKAPEKSVRAECKGLKKDKSRLNVAQQQLNG